MYTYGELLDDVNYLSRYGVETGAIGSSAYGRIIPYVKIGAGKHSVMVTAAIHAREHVSALFAVRQMYKLFAAPPECGVYFVPIVNPDGNVLVSEGRTPTDCSRSTAETKISRFGKPTPRAWT